MSLQKNDPADNKLAKIVDLEKPEFKYLTTEPYGITRKWNMRRNLWELLDYTLQNGPHRCPETGSAIMLKNATYMGKVSLLFIAAYTSIYKFFDYLKKMDTNMIKKVHPG